MFNKVFLVIISLSMWQHKSPFVDKNGQLHSSCPCSYVILWILINLGWTCRMLYPWLFTSLQHNHSLAEILRLLYFDDKCNWSSIITWDIFVMFMAELNFAYGFPWSILFDIDWCRICSFFLEFLESIIVELTKLMLGLTTNAAFFLIPEFTPSITLLEYSSKWSRFRRLWKKIFSHVLQRCSCRMFQHLL